MTASWLVKGFFGYLFERPGGARKHGNRSAIYDDVVVISESWLWHHDSATGC